MQAGRVRRALEHYYLTVGKHDPIAISLSKGTCAPAFEFKTGAESVP
jgi:adenylate cyclase